MSYKEIIDNVSNIEDLDNVTILKVLEKFSKTIKDFAIEQSGLNNLVNVEFIPSDNNTTYTGDSVDYLGTLKLTLSDNIIVNKSCNIKFNIKGSNTIVVNVDEFNNSLELHLDNSVVTTLAFAESERQKSQTDGAILHEKQIEITIGNATLNTNVLSSGEVSWVKQGKLVVVSFSDLKFKGSIAHQNLYFSGLPKNAIKSQTFLLHQLNASGGSSLRCMIQIGSTEIINWYQDTTLDTNAQYYGQLTYITDEN